MAAWPSGLGRGLQSPVRRFDSARRLQSKHQVDGAFWLRLFVRSLATSLKRSRWLEDVALPPLAGDYVVATRRRGQLGESFGSFALAQTG